MFGCNKRSAVRKSVLNNQIRYGKRKNYIMKFLILIKEDDTKNKSWICNESLQIKLLKFNKYFPGDLQILFLNEIENNNTEYIIEDTPIPNEIYIKLPCKNIYVLAEKYPLKYLLSKQNELTNIFTTLGAKSIKWSINKSQINTLNVNTELTNNNIGESFGISSVNSNSDSVVNEMKFEYNDIIENINDDTFNDDKFYYLAKEYEWQDIISHRLNNNLVYDKYTFSCNNNIKFSSSLKSKLKFFDISLNYETDNINNIEIFYEIEYFEFHKKNTNILDLVDINIDDDIKKNIYK